MELTTKKFITIKTVILLEAFRTFIPTKIIKSGNEIYITKENEIFESFENYCNSGFECIPDNNILTKQQICELWNEFTNLNYEVK